MSLYQEVEKKKPQKKGLGLIHAYFGQGVGKSTRVIGLAVRAAGSGFDVHFIQFMKSADSGEVNIFNQIPNIHYYCPGKHGFIKNNGPSSEHIEHAALALEKAWEAARSGAQLLICDEILNTLLFKVLNKEQVFELVEFCRGKTELVMTGADVGENILETVDYATEFVQRKHPYYDGVIARKGIEF